MKTRTARTLVLSSLLLVPAVAQAGPPLVCFPMSIGDASTLPWGRGWHEPRADYDRSRLAADTLAALAAHDGTLVHMETLRRAVLYASTDDTAAGALFAALRARARGEARSRAAALARFDLGYGAAAYREAVAVSHRDGIALPEDAATLVSAALEARPDPAMEYALALVLLDLRQRGAAEAHLRTAAAGASGGSDLARTLDAHAPLWGGRPAVRAAGALR